MSFQGKDGDLLRQECVRFCRSRHLPEPKSGKRYVSKIDCLNTNSEETVVNVPDSKYNCSPKVVDQEDKIKVSSNPLNINCRRPLSVGAHAGSSLRNSKELS